MNRRPREPSAAQELPSTARVEDLLAELDQFFAPLYPALASPQGLERFLQTLGYDGAQASLAGAVTALASARTDLDQLNALVEQLEEDNRGPTAPEVAQLLESARHRLQRRAPAPRSAQLARPAGFLRGRFDYLLVEYLYYRFPLLFRFLVLLGVLRIEHLRPVRDQGARQVPFDRYVLRWDRLSRWIEDPGAVAEEVYGWGTAAFDANGLLHNLALTFWSVGLPATPVKPVDAVATRSSASSRSPGANRHRVPPLPDRSGWRQGRNRPPRRPGKGAGRERHRARHHALPPRERRRGAPAERRRHADPHRRR